jgi:hypothetical protein
MDSSSPSTTAQILLPLTSTSLDPHIDVLREKRFGSDGEVIGEVKKWLRVQNSNW